ncbi:MAG: type IV pilus assembly protein PilM [Patescibacteria group bacterium]|nr:type IV pilus assembly protein PilM [Patescibacteria group bacterium]
MQLEDRVLSVFPPPEFLSFPSAGIEISDGSVKHVLLRQRGDAAELVSYSETPLPQGAVYQGGIEAPEKVVEVLRSIRLRHGIHYANVSLPERKAYLYETVVPEGAGNVRASIEADLETHVPLPPGEAVFDFDRLQKTNGGTAVSVTAYARRIVHVYRQAFEKAGITLRVLETESHALARAALAGERASGTVMVIDSGKRATRVVVSENGTVVFTATIDIGGDSLTAALMKRFAISQVEAEQMKDEKGFLMSAENMDVVEAMIATLSVVKEEIGKYLSYLQDPVNDRRRTVERVIVCGGNANLRGFPEYLESALGLPVAYANVWSGAFSLDEYIPPMPFSESLEYATAIGLAKRGNPNMPW